MGKKDARCEYASGAAACVPRSGAAAWSYFVILFDNSIDFDRIRHYNGIDIKEFNLPSASSEGNRKPGAKPGRSQPL